jgi:archaellin
MPQFSLQAGNDYQIEVFTKNGTHLTSSFEKMASAPEIDSVYYERKDIVNNNPSFPTKGIQFYIDFNAGSSNSPYVKWDLEETWEYHTEYPMEVIYDGSWNFIVPYDYSRKVCWKTTTVDEIFTLSTQNIQSSSYRKFPLHFVDNHSSRLAYGYNLLITQSALSESAYQYWDKIRINQHNTGGLYQQQPLAVRGNMQNLTRPDEEVLGYFSASAIKTKRIFVSNVPDLEMDYWNFCSGAMDLVQGWNDGASPATPIYLVYVEGSLKVVDEFCVDCLLQSGTNIKPDFWPNKK